MKKHIQGIAFLLQLIGLVLFSLTTSESFLTLFNTTTYIFLFHLLIYLSLVTLHARFFDGFLYGMHRVFRSKNRPGSMEAEFQPVSEKIKRPVVHFFKYQTLFFLLSNLLLLVFYLLN